MHGGLKVDSSLQPHISFESASDCRFAHDLSFWYTYIEQKAVHIQFHDADIFSRYLISGKTIFQDFSHDLIPGTFDSVRHDVRIHDRKYIFRYQSS